MNLDLFDYFQKCINVNKMNESPDIAAIPMLQRKQNKIKNINLVKQNGLTKT